MVRGKSPLPDSRATKRTGSSSRQVQIMPDMPAFNEIKCTPPTGWIWWVAADSSVTVASLYGSGLMSSGGMPVEVLTTPVVLLIHVVSSTCELLQSPVATNPMTLLEIVAYWIQSDCAADNSTPAPPLVPPVVSVKVLVSTFVIVSPVVTDSVMPVAALVINVCVMRRDIFSPPFIINHQRGGLRTVQPLQ